MSETCPEPRASSLVARARDSGSGACALVGGAGTWGESLATGYWGPWLSGLCLVSEARFWALW